MKPDIVVREAELPPDWEQAVRTLKGLEKFAESMGGEVVHSGLLRSFFGNPTPYIGMKAGGFSIKAELKFRFRGEDGPEAGPDAGEQG
jgi:hypothetical protein